MSTLFRQRPVPMSNANREEAVVAPVAAPVRPVPQTAPNRPVDRPLTRGERERLAVQHLRLVESIARRIHSRLPRSVELEDLVNEGMIGLLEAIDRYDAHRSVPLHLFARQRITGAILDLLRNLDWVPRTVRRRAEMIDSARETLAGNLGRAPNREEVAQALGLQPADYDEMVQNSQIRKLASLDAPCSHESTTPIIDTLSVEDDAAEGCRMEELRHAVLDAVERLPPKERLAVRGFYLEERPLLDIGRDLGVSESRASQLHRMGVSRLRFKVREHID